MVHIVVRYVKGVQKCLTQQANVTFMLKIKYIFNITFINKHSAIINYTISTRTDGRKLCGRIKVLRHIYASRPPFLLTSCQFDEKSHPRIKETSGRDGTHERSPLLHTESHLTDNLDRFPLINPAVDRVRARARSHPMRLDVDYNVGACPINGEANNLSI